MHDLPQRQKTMMPHREWAENLGKGVRRQVCVCVKSVRPLLVLDIAVQHGSCPLVQRRRRSGNLKNARAGFEVGPHLVFLELLCVRTVRYLCVTGYIASLNL